MFTGVDLDKAINFWKKGKEVLVLDRTVKSSAGGYETYPLGELFRNLEFLADVPAVEDQEFRQAVEDMVHGSDQDAMDEKDSMKGELLSPPLTRPETEQPPAGKSKKELALELFDRGISVKEIADRIGAKYNTVYYWIHAKTQKKPGWNQDRHACRTCVYRATGTLKTNGAGCDYVTITQRIRDCSVEDCDKYIKGAPKSKKQVKDDGKENE